MSTEQSCIPSINLDSRDNEARKRSAELLASKKSSTVNISPIQVERQRNFAYTSDESPLGSENFGKKSSFNFNDEDNPGMANALLLAREFKTLQKKKQN